jgi:hypothetical protein
MKHLITEVWTQDTQDSDLWHGKFGVMLNTVALDEREAFFDVIRVPAMPHSTPQQRYLIAR